MDERRFYDEKEETKQQAVRLPALPPGNYVPCALDGAN